MLIADANGPAFVEPIEAPTPTPEVMETTTNVVEQPTPLSEATPADVSSPSWIVLLLVVLAMAAAAVYQVLRGKKDGKKKVAK